MDDMDVMDLTDAMDVSERVHAVHRVHDVHVRSRESHWAADERQYLVLPRRRVRLADGDQPVEVVALEH